MAKPFVFKFREILVSAMLVLAVAALSLTALQPAHAAGFADDVAGKTTIKLKDIPGVGKVLSDLKLSKLADTDMASVKATETRFPASSIFSRCGGTSSSSRAARKPTSPWSR